MYNVHWTHSLHCFEFVELTLIYFSRDSSPLSNKIEYNCFSFQILPTSIGSSSLVTATGCFSYPDLINDRRQTDRAAASAMELPDTSVSPTEYWAFGSCWGASSQNGLQMARANVLLYSLASSMIRVSGAVSKSCKVLSGVACAAKKLPCLNRYPTPCERASCNAL